MITRDKIVLIGGGGHCQSCIDVIETQGAFRIVGIVDKKEKVGDKVLGYPVIGCDDDLPRLVKEYKNFFVAVGQVRTSDMRIERFAFLKSKGVRLPSIVSPLAHVSRHASLGEGTIVMHRAVVNAGAKVGANSIINTAALIEHGSHVYDNTHVSTAAVVNGDCTIGNRVFLGSNCVISHSLMIADDVVVGAGTVVINSLLKPGVYAGVPAQKVHRI